MAGAPHYLFDHSPIVRRPALRWPDGKKIAFYLAINVEHHHVDKPALSLAPITSRLRPDPLNYGWREYGPRVGIWRIVELLDRLGLAATVLLNSEVCQSYPEIIEEGNRRGWAWVAHGQSSSLFHTGMEEPQERLVLAEIADTIEQATGRRAVGWLGPALTETYNTPRLAAELGFRYLLDWTLDDQPFPLKVDGMISVPYSVELNDVAMFMDHGYTGPEFRQAVIDQMEVLLADSEGGGRVMCLAVHPFIVGQPFRHKYLAEALEVVCSSDEVWFTTADEIAAWYAAQ